MLDMIISIVIWWFLVGIFVVAVYCVIVPREPEEPPTTRWNRERRD